MKNTMILAALLATASMVAMNASADDDADGEPKYTIKEVMKKGHGGRMSLVKKVIAGDASADEEKLLLEMYQSMAAQEQPMGEAESWKTKTTALVAAAQAVVDDKDGASALLKEASNCGDCHGPHKPPKN